jgi:hypothetical protein
MKNELYSLFKNNAMYIVFGFFILLNIFCFPDVLNNKNIKINDESWIIQQNTGEVINDLNIVLILFI